MCDRPGGTARGAPGGDWPGGDWPGAHGGIEIQHVTSGASAGDAIAAGASVVTQTGLAGRCQLRYETSWMSYWLYRGYRFFGAQLRQGIAA
jgi:hypothetical protein